MFLVREINLLSIRYRHPLGFQCQIFINKILNLLSVNRYTEGLRCGGFKALFTTAEDRTIFTLCNEF